MDRRDFIKTTASQGVGLSAIPLLGTSPENTTPQNAGRTPAPPALVHPTETALDLKPAEWIWYPSTRTLANTVILFRKEFDLPADAAATTGWILADSRYRLFINGKRVQWGPAPSDPRWQEADPLDGVTVLHKGRNLIAMEVLFYGHGEGTWPIGKPGMILNLQVSCQNGSMQQIVSDSSWKTFLARCWKPGQYKRWFLRSLQEEFDARLYPYGWMEPDAKLSEDWLPAMPTGGASNKPSICADYSEYAMEIWGISPANAIRKRSIPLMREFLLPAKRLAESSWIQWKRPPVEYFENLPENAFICLRGQSASETGTGAWRVALNGGRAAALTFEFEEQIVGWPVFTIEAAEGTVVELMVQEAHQVGGAPLLNTHFHSWTRFICKEGSNTFETFDFESFRWLQLHVREMKREVTVSGVGVRRRVYPWLRTPEIRVDEPALQKLFSASINTLHNSAQELVVDGMARERQQYSGDGSHQLHAIYPVFGEARLPARFVTTFGQGQTLDGYFLDCWPGYDRLARIMERQLQLTGWGPLLDHGVGYNFDCWYYYMYTGDRASLREPFPRLIRFMQYLQSIRRDDGLLPVERIGIPSVYIDHHAFKKQKHKQCAFNLYTAAMLTHALAPLCGIMDEKQWKAEALRMGRSLLDSCRSVYWSNTHGCFVDNLPWLNEEKTMRVSDRTLATSILFDQTPRGNDATSVHMLADLPPEVGFSYPANACWRLWALAKAGESGTVVNDLRRRWAVMDSVSLNNTLQEYWIVKPDSDYQWSHCAVVPLYVLTMNIAGIRPLAPGFTDIEIMPQLSDLARCELTYHTVQGPILFKSNGAVGNRSLILAVPASSTAELIVDNRERLSLAELGPSRHKGKKRYRLISGTENAVQLQYT